MARLVTYSIAALAIVFLMGSRAAGGMMYASTFEAGRHADVSLSRQNIAVQPPSIGVDDAIWVHTLPLANLERGIHTLNYGQELLTAPSLASDTWHVSDGPTTAFRLLFAGPLVSSNNIQLTNLLEPSDISEDDFACKGLGLKSAVYPPDPLLENDDDSVLQPFGVSEVTVQGLNPQPRMVSSHQRFDDAILSIPHPSDPFNKDWPRSFPERQLPQEAIRIPTGSEIVSRMLKGNADAHRLRHWPLSTPETRTGPV